MSQPPTINVMLVDDSAVIRGMITKALSESPNIKIVASAMNGQVALNELERQKIDVILLDQEMPEMDGITALPKLVAASPETKIIMVSALTSKGAEMTIRALKLGATDCIAKPSQSRDKDELQKFFTKLRDKIAALFPSHGSATMAQNTVIPSQL